MHVTRLWVFRLQTFGICVLLFIAVFAMGFGATYRLMETYRQSDFITVRDVTKPADPLPPIRGGCLTLARTLCQKV